LVPESFGEAANLPCFALLTGIPPPGRCGLLIYQTRILPNSGGPALIANVATLTSLEPQL
jgi:hypothetical protein